ncbi:MAG: hypothetical protein IKX85_00285 [Clostridia bacterium]|nr:hypothetical protein [Clostridia bacterium]
MMDGAETETQKDTDLASSSGEFAIGVMKKSFGEESFGASAYSALLNDYALSSGVRIEIREYVSDKEMIDAARSGEVDLIAGNDLVNLILAHEGSLRELEPVLGGLLGTGEYFDNILESGRIDGRLLIAIPHFLLAEEVCLPAKAIADRGGAPRNMEELFALYDGLEEGYRSNGIDRSQLESVLDAALDWGKGEIDLAHPFGDFASLVRRTETDAEKFAFLTEEVPVQPLFRLGRGYPGIEPLEHFYEKDGEPYSKYGSEARLIPFPIRENKGFLIRTESLAVPEKAENPSDAFAFLSWLFSKEGQETMRKGDKPKYPGGCPVWKSGARLWAAAGIKDETEREKIADLWEDYAKEADRLPPTSENLLLSIDQLIDLRTLGEENRERWETARENKEDSEQWEYYCDEEIAQSLLYRYEERMKGLPEKPPYYKDGTWPDWIPYLEGFIAEYMKELGLGLRTASAG